MSTPDDALWVTDANPTADDSGGLILPLNDKARSKSDVGTDVEPGAPVYRGFADYGTWIMAAETCARVPQ